jgi:desulfoferrodoxin (superoxide reductase-like protein)
MSQADVPNVFAALHNELARLEGSPLVADVWRSFADDRAPLAKHTPTVTISGTVANITVRHGSEHGHYIMASWLEDEGGHICGSCRYQEPGSGEDGTNVSICSIDLSANCASSASVTAYEFCNLHGLWVGQSTNVADWTLFNTYLAAHNAHGTYRVDLPSTHSDEKFTKHTPTTEIIFTSSGPADPPTARVTVRHGSTHGHWIEGLFLFDQNGEIYRLGPYAEPDASGPNDLLTRVDRFTLPLHVTEVTPVESCNLHGLWAGQPASIGNWHQVLNYVLREGFASHRGEEDPKHAPKVSRGTSEGTASVKVAHSSTAGHWIEATWLLDQNGELYGPVVHAEPDTSGLWDTDLVVDEFAVHPNVQSVISYSLCNVHGLWINTLDKFSAALALDTEAEATCSK